jgi:hypothetical protein
MKVIKLKPEGSNNGKLKRSLPEQSDQTVKIKSGRYIENDTSHPLYDEHEKYFRRIYSLEYKRHYVYWLKDERQGTSVGEMA